VDISRAAVRTHILEACLRFADCFMSRELWELLIRQDPGVPILGNSWNMLRNSQFFHINQSWLRDLDRHQMPGFKIQTGHFRRTCSPIVGITMGILLFNILIWVGLCCSFLFWKWIV